MTKKRRQFLSNFGINLIAHQTSTQLGVYDGSVLSISLTFLLMVLALSMLICLTHFYGMARRSFILYLLHISLVIVVLLNKYLNCNKSKSQVHILQNVNNNAASGATDWDYDQPD